MGAIHNMRAIIDEGSIYNIPIFINYGLGKKGNMIHNPGRIIDQK